MPQLVAPLIAPILGVGAASTTAVVASNLLVYAATTAASMLIEMANQPQQQDPGTKLHAASGGAVNQSIIVGQKETAGSLIYAGSWGKAGKTPNGYYSRVFCLQDMPSNGILSRCWTSDNKGTIDLDHINFTDDNTDYPADGSGYSGSGTSMGHPITSLDHDGLHYAWVKILDGTQTVADPFLMQQFGGLDDRPWKDTMIGRGRTLMIVTQRWTDKESDEEKNVVVTLGTIPLYDWRNDSTNGGSGSQRWGTQSTYGAGGNPIVIAYNIMRGIYYGDEWVYGGKDWPARRFDHDTWTAAANACDEDITLAAGGTEKRFRMGAEINLTEDPLTVLDRIFAACGGRLVESGGIYKVYVGGIGASVYSFDDGDLILTEALTGTMFPTREEICNTITGTYCEPNNGGQMKAFRKRFKDAYIDEDGGETRAKDMTFDYVRSNTQAQRLALQALNDNRRFGSKLIALPALSRKLEPGDTVNWSSSDRFGYSNKKWIIGDVTFTRYGIVFVAMREGDSSDSDWSTSDEDAYTVGVYGDIRPDTQILDLTAEAHGVKNDAGTFRQPGIRITWPTDADMVDCKAVRWQVRPFGQEIIDRGRVEFDEGEALIKDGIERNGTYQVRGRIIPFSGRDTDYCDWITIVADDYGAIGDDDTDDTKPAKPTGLGLTPFIRTLESGESVLKLKAAWTASVGLSNKGHYIVYVDDGDSVEKYPTDDLDPSTSFRIRSGIAIAVYVRAVNGVGVKSDASSVITATYTKKAVNTDTASGLTVTTGFRENTLKWTKAAQADHKWTAVYRRTTSGPGSWALLDTVKGTRFVDKDIDPGTGYDYKIKHIDTSDNEGPESDVAEDNAAIFIRNEDVKVSDLQPDVLNANVFSIDEVAIDDVFDLVDFAQNIIAEIVVTFDASPEPSITRRFMLIGHVTSTVLGDGLPTANVQLGMDIDEIGDGYTGTGSAEPPYSPTTWRPTDGGQPGICSKSFTVSLLGSQTSIKFAMKAWIDVGNTASLKERHLMIIEMNSGS